MATPIQTEMSFGTGHSQRVQREFSLLILYILYFCRQSMFR